MNRMNLHLGRLRLIQPPGAWASAGLAGYSRLTAPDVASGVCAWPPSPYGEVPHAQFGDCNRAYDWLHRDRGRQHYGRDAQ